MTALIGAGVFAGVVIGYGYTGDTTARHIVLGCGIGLAVILCIVAGCLGARRSR